MYTTWERNRSQCATIKTYKINKAKVRNKICKNSRNIEKGIKTIENRYTYETNLKLI